MDIARTPFGSDCSAASVAPQLRAFCPTFRARRAECPTPGESNPESDRRRLIFYATMRLNNRIRPRGKLTAASLWPIFAQSRRQNHSKNPSFFQFRLPGVEQKKLSDATVSRGVFHQAGTSPVQLRPRPRHSFFLDSSAAPSPRQRTRIQRPSPSGGAALAEAGRHRAGNGGFSPPARRLRVPWFVQTNFNRADLVEIIHIIARSFCSHYPSIRSCRYGDDKQRATACARGFGCRSFINPNGSAAGRGAYRHLYPNHSDQRRARGLLARGRPDQTKRTVSALRS